MSGDRTRAPYAQVVFSGGGLRCFWHGGWMEAAGRRLDFRPERVTGSSGGALSAAAWLAVREDFLFDRFARALEREDCNFNPDDLDDDKGRSPHQRVYEAIVEDVIDADAQARIAEGPAAFQINVSTTGDTGHTTLRARRGDDLSGRAGRGSHTAPPPVVGGGHGPASHRRAAGRPRRHLRRSDPDGGDRSPALPSRCMARTGDEDGVPIYDGGMADKAPLPEPDEGRTLVLLTKRFRSLPGDDPDRIEYVMPSKAVLDGSKPDFTDPRLLRQAWEQGREDGALWLDRTQ